MGCRPFCSHANLTRIRLKIQYHFLIRSAVIKIHFGFPSSNDQSHINQVFIVALLGPRLVFRMLQVCPRNPECEWEKVVTFHEVAGVGVVHEDLVSPMVVIQITDLLNANYTWNLRKEKIPAYSDYYL